ncbi:MAG: elongation factor P [Pseudomonadota bacterium]
MQSFNIALLTGFAALVAASGTSFGVLEDAAATAPPSNAPAGGMLRTMPHGTYQCALPGDVTGRAITVVAEENFRISGASRYRAAQGSGIYLLRGQTLTFTRGPKKGERFRRVGTNQLQRLGADGELDKLICTRLGNSG